MAHRRLNNYLRSYRKRAGLSQDEVAFLLGMSGGPKISRYERATRLPSLQTVLAYEALFGVPARELFAGTYDKVEHTAKRRAQTLARRITSTPHTRWTAQKLAALGPLAGSAAHQTEQS